MASTHTNALQISGLVHSYGRGANAVRSLHGVDVTIPRGTFTAVMGPSGSGKSTLLACAAGLESPAAGIVCAGDTDLTGLGEEERTVFRRERLGMVFQGFHLLPYLTAEQNVELPVRLSGARVDRATRERVRGLLTNVGLGEYSRRLPAELSGGQQQRVAIARALVCDPEVILADEPTGALDSTTARGILEQLRSCVDDMGQTVVMVTHDPVAASYADLALFLRDGQIAGEMEQPTAAGVAGELANLTNLDQLVAV